MGALLSSVLSFSRAWTLALVLVLGCLLSLPLILADEDLEEKTEEGFDREVAELTEGELGEEVGEVELGEEMPLDEEVSEEEGNVLAEVGEEGGREFFDDEIGELEESEVTKEKAGDKAVVQELSLEKGQMESQGGKQGALTEGGATADSGDEVMPRSDDELLSQLEAESEEPSSEMGVAVSSSESIPLPKKAPGDSEGGPNELLPQMEGILGEVFGPNGEGLPGVVVSIPAMDRSTRADQEGEFGFADLPAAELVIQFNKLGYKVASRTVILKEGESVEISQAMEEQPVEYDDGEYEMDEVEVVGEYVEEEKAEIVFDDVAGGIKLEASIGQVEFTKKNISTAADAIAKISGANVVDGKRPVVRGLADRYITTTFNGGSVASTTPLRKAVELDLFPTSVIQEIKINKVYNATLPGDFGGAAIDIVSRNFPEERTFSFKVDSGFNDNWVGDDFFVSQAPELDFWGNADFPDYRAILGAAEGATAEERALIWGEAVRTHNFLPEKDNQQMDLGFSLNYGDSFDVGRSGKFGVVLAVSHDNEDRAIVGGLVDRGDSGGRYLFDDFQRTVDWSSMLGLTWQVSDAHELKATFFKKHVGTSLARNLYNWEDPAGEFEITRELVTESNNGGLYASIGGNVAEVLGGNFWGIIQDENSLEIVQLAGRHKLFGDSLDDEDGALFEWALTRTENEIVTDTSVTRRIELDFDSAAVREASAGAGLTVDQFTVDTRFAGDAQSLAQSTYLKPRFGNATDRPLSSADVASIQSWSDLESLLLNAGVSTNALDTYNNSLAGALDGANQPRTDYDPSRGTAFAIYNGVTPNQLKSFKENFTQFERTENFKTDFTFPFLLGGSELESRLTLRTGINYERRNRSERAIEVAVDNQRWGQVASDDVLTPGSDPSGGYSQIFIDTANSSNGTAPILDPTLEPGSAVSEARDIDAEVITTGYYGDAEYRSGDFVFRVGGRHEQVDRSYVLLGFGDGSGGQSQNKANIFGASAGYTFSNDLSFLVGMSNTVARPVVKETLPVRQVNQEDGSTFRGNAELQDAEIQNLDLSLVFPEYNGINSRLSLFHKKLTGPPVYIDNAGDVTIANGDSGLIRGLEFETEVDLMGPFSFDLNYAYIQGDLKYGGLSTSSVPGEDLVSTFPEQPRHVLNMSLGYESEDLGLNVNLAYNYVSEYVVTLPSTSNGAFQMKQPSPKLDLVFTKNFEVYDSDLVLGFAMKNILGSNDEVWNVGYQDNGFQGIRSEYSPGRNFSFWLKSTF